MTPTRATRFPATNRRRTACAVGALVLLALLLLPATALVAPSPPGGAHVLAAETVASALSPAQAQGGQGGSPLASQTLGRGYWHVFIAYAVAWLLVLGWAISIARRLSKVEREIEE